jgi:hypothetical protein
MLNKKYYSIGYSFIHRSIGLYKNIIIVFIDDMDQIEHMNIYIIITKAKPQHVIEDKHEKFSYSTGRFT